ncbi:hypothetical protein B0H19DRAFT_1383268 [Mycena capillaripes]|nr:hypothetical protein B0H19DRAFT_1383268 [Mycena capillaripes]
MPSTVTSTWPGSHCWCMTSLDLKVGGAIHLDDRAHQGVGLVSLCPLLRTVRERDHLRSLSCVTVIIFNHLLIAIQELIVRITLILRVLAMYSFDKRVSTICLAKLTNIMLYYFSGNVCGFVLQKSSDLDPPFKIGNMNIGMSAFTIALSVTMQTDAQPPRSRVNYE